MLFITLSVFFLEGWGTGIADVALMRCLLNGDLRLVQPKSLKPIVAPAHARLFHLHGYLPLIPSGIVYCMGRHSLVAYVFTRPCGSFRIEEILAFLLLQCRSRVLIKFKEGQDDDLVVEERSEDKEHETKELEE